MVYRRQETTTKFVNFGKDKGLGNAIVIKEGKYLEGKIVGIKDSDTYKKIYDLNAKISKDKEEVVTILGTAILNREMGYEFDEEGELKPLEECQANYRVQVGDMVRIHFDGMIKTKRGKEAYDLWIEIDDGKK